MGNLQDRLEYCESAGRSVVKPTSHCTPDQSREMALVESCTIKPCLIVLSCPERKFLSVLSIDTLLKLAAFVMATEAIPKPLASSVASMEAVPEFNPERAPVATSSPRRAVVLTSGPGRAPVPEFSSERALVPRYSPGRATGLASGPWRATGLRDQSFPQGFFLGGGDGVCRAPDVEAGPKDEATAMEATPSWPLEPSFPSCMPLFGSCSCQFHLCFINPVYFSPVFSLI